jgi:ABC-type amino acid transport substrate-binding protein
MKHWRLLTTLLWLCLLTSWVWAGSLRTGLQDSYPKYFEKNGQMQGVCYDMLVEIARRAPELNIQIPSKFTPFKRIQQDLATGEIDFFVGIAKDEGRTDDYVFLPQALYDVNHVLVVRSQDSVQIETFAQLAQTKPGIVLTPSGTATYKFLSKQKGLKIDAGTRSLEANLQKLAWERGRFVYFHDLALLATLAQPQNADRFRILPTSFKKYQHYVALSKRLPLITRQRFAAVLEEMSKDGTLREIFNRYTQRKSS